MMDAMVWTLVGVLFGVIFILLNDLNKRMINVSRDVQGLLDRETKALKNMQLHTETTGMLVDRVNKMENERNK